MSIRVLLLVFLLTSCGGGGAGGHGPDAGPPDGAAGAPVTVSVTDRGVPHAGVHVYFVAADGTPVATVDTGADGTASAVLTAGGSVTLIDALPDLAPVVGANQLFSYLGVQPGDHLVLLRSDRAAVSFALTAPAVTAATRYDVFSTCGGDTLQPDPAGGPTASGTVMLEGCGGTTDLAIVANRVDPVTHVSTPISGLFHGGATADGTAVSVTDPYSALIGRSFTCRNPPTGVQLDVKHSPLAAHGPLGPFALTLTGSTGTLQEPVTVASSAVTVSYDQNLGNHRVMEWGTLPADYELDVAGVMLPDIVERPSVDIAGGRVKWVDGPLGPSADASVALMGVSRPAQSRKWSWLLVAPYTRSEIRLPHLPTDVADWTPAGDDAVGVEQVSIIKVTGGYDAFRTRSLDLGRDDLSLIKGPQGTMVTVDADGVRVAADHTGLDGPPARRAIFGSRR